MAAITPIETGSQLKGTSATVTTVTYGAAVTSGDILYRNSADGKYYQAQSSSAAAAAAVAIAVKSAGTDELGLIISAGEYDFGATLVVGQVYCVGNAAGSLVPYSDLTTGDYVTIVGVATGADELSISWCVSGVAKP